jgi:cell volume regulation protein A
MSEISDFAQLLLPVAAVLALVIVSTRVSTRWPIPVPGIFLLAFALWAKTIDVVIVERVAVVALIVILLNGGMDIGWRRMRGALRPVLSLGVVGTFLTAGLLAVVAHFALGFSWELSGLIGAALAPTDPAVTFSVLGEIKGRAGTVLEGEAGVNDPAGIALMLGMIELTTHDDASLLAVAGEFALEMAVGLVAGYAGARVMLPIVRRVRLGSGELRPILLLTLAVVLYALTTLAHGSGFLAVFVAGLFIGDAELSEVRAFTHSLATVAEVAVFAGLGLTMSLLDLPTDAWWQGALLTLVLALVIRPLVVVLLVRGDRLFIAWSGLKGAVPILLAAFAVLGGVDGAQTVYGIVFVAVLLSVFGQGSLVPAVARRTLR